MKNLVKRQWLFLYALIPVLAISSCSDDDDANVKQGFKVDGEKGSITQAFVVTNMQTDDLYRHQVILGGDELEVESGPTVNGESDVVSFSLISESDELEEGEYVIRDNPDEENEASLVILYLNYSSDGGGEDYERAFAGTGTRIKVSKNGDNYTLSFSCPSVLTIVSNTGTPIFLPVDGDLQVHYSGEVNFISDVEETLRKTDSKLLFP